MTMRRKLATAAFTTLALLAAACGDDDDTATDPGGTSPGGGEETPAESVDAVTIGLVDDFSGGQSVIAENMALGVEQAVEQLNADGGIEALGGAELRVERYDTETDTNTVTAQTTRAIDDGVHAILGASISDSAIAGTNVSSRAGVPWIVTGATSAEVTSRGLDNAFMIAPNTEVFARDYHEVMTWACEELGCADEPTLGLSISDTTYGNDIASRFKNVNADGGFEIASEVSYPPSTEDLSSVAARMISGNPDAVFNAGYPNDGLQLGRIFATTLDTTAKVFTSTATYQVVEEELGADGDGMIMLGDMSSLFDSLPESYVEQNEIFREEHGEDMHYMVLRGYMATMMLAEALEAAGTTDGAAVSEALHDVELTHEEGNLWAQDTISFTEEGALDGGELLFVQIQDGEAVGVYPPELAKAEVQPYR